MTNPNDAAFSKAAFYNENTGMDQAQEGLTKREYFAALAMQGLLANNIYTNVANVVSANAVEHADALIAQLNEPVV